MLSLEINRSRKIRPNAAETYPPTALRHAHKLQLLRTPVRLPAAVERPVQTPVLAIQEGVRAKTIVQTRNRARPGVVRNGISQDDGGCALLVESYIGEDHLYCSDWDKEKCYKVFWRRLSWIIKGHGVNITWPLVKAQLNYVCASHPGFHDMNNGVCSNT